MEPIPPQKPPRGHPCDSGQTCDSLSTPLKRANGDPKSLGFPLQSALLREPFRPGLLTFGVTLCALPCRLALAPVRRFLFVRGAIRPRLRLALCRSAARCGLVSFVDGRDRPEFELVPLDRCKLEEPPGQRSRDRWRPPVLRPSGGLPIERLVGDRLRLADRYPWDPCDVADFSKSCRRKRSLIGKKASNNKRKAISIDWQSILLSKIDQAPDFSDQDHASSSTGK